MTKELKAEVREQLGKGATNRLRKTGMIPAIVYGHGQPINIAVNERNFNNSFKKISENEIIKLSVGSNSRSVLIKDYQRNYIKGTITHLDFFEIEKGKAIKTHVPIKITGVAPGLREGGILEHSIHELEIECQAENMPEIVEVDISNLVLGHAIHVRDIKPIKGVKIFNKPEQVIVLIVHAKVEVVAALVTPATPAPEATSK